MEKYLVILHMAYSAVLNLDEELDEEHFVMLSVSKALYAFTGKPISWLAKTDKYTTSKTATETPCLRLLPIVPECCLCAGA